MIAQPILPDKYWKLIKKTDERIKLYFNGENLGYTKNFEKAVTLCTGKYIAFADQDDIWGSSKISDMLAEMDGHVMVFS